jgi:hypothetical protein
MNVCPLIRQLRTHFGVFISAVTYSSPGFIRAYNLLDFKMFTELTILLFTACYDTKLCTSRTISEIIGAQHAQNAEKADFADS